MLVGFRECWSGPTSLVTTLGVALVGLDDKIGYFRHSFVVLGLREDGRSRLPHEGSVSLHHLYTTMTKDTGLAMLNTLRPGRILESGLTLVLV